MSFEITSELPPTPAVRIFFHGLLIWTPDRANNKHCYIGVHRGATDHYLTFEVRIKRLGEPDYIIMRHAGPLNFLENDSEGPGIQLKVFPETGEGVRKFINSARPFDRKAGSTSDPNDYLWAIDLEKMHDGMVKIDSHVIKPGVLVTDGIIHTALKTPDDVQITKVKDGSPPEDFYPIAAIAGINIYLTPEQTLSVQFRKDGLRQDLPLKTHKPSDVSYEIYIDNNPTYMTEGHSEFREYYKALPDMLASKQLDLKFHPPETDHPLKFIDKGDGLGTPRIACMPVGSGG